VAVWFILEAPMLLNIITFYVIARNNWCTFQS